MPHILVVEDNNDVRSFVSTFLRRQGYTVDEAADGQLAMDLMGRQVPDLVLLDVLLPKIDGLEVLRRMRRTETLREVPVIMMSAVLQTRDIKAETEKLEVASFVQKPFQIRAVVQEIERILQTRDRAASASSKSTVSIRANAIATTASSSQRRILYQRNPLPARGHLSDCPVPDLLHAIYVEARTGRLVIAAGATKKAIYFVSGSPVYAVSSLPEETLGAYLVQRGKLDAAQQSQAVEEMSATGRQFGDVLLRLGFMNPHELFAEIEGHLASKIVSTLGWIDGVFAFEDGDAWKDEVIIARLNAGRVLLDGIQRHWPPSECPKRLPLSDTFRAFALESPRYSDEELKLTTLESRVLQMARRGSTRGEMVRGLDDGPLVTTTLFAFWLMELIGFTADERSVVTKLPPVTPPREAPIDEKARALMAEYIKYRTADHFKLLGINRDATPQEVEAAYRERSRRYHPDTLVGIDTGLVHEKIEELFVRLQNAYRVLSNPEERARYVAHLDSRSEGSIVAPLGLPASAMKLPASVSGGTQPRASSPTISMARRTLLPHKAEHQTLFDDAMTLARTGEVKAAAELLQRAVELQPLPLYQGWLAWLSYLNDHTQRDKSLADLNQLRQQNDQDATFPYLMGLIMLREKDVRHAEEYLVIAVRLDPKHVDATRQLRVIRMRQTGNETSVLFDLFKKK